jgi:hypothetical protein
MALKNLPPYTYPMLNLNGVRISGEAFAAFIDTITNPDPKRWYRFERQGDQIIVEVRESDPWNIA